MLKNLFIDNVIDLELMKNVNNLISTISKKSKLGDKLQGYQFSDFDQDKKMQFLFKMKMEASGEKEMSI